ncbi:MAG: ATP-binding protein [Firmicutes bacterium]|nr:ATP-binding protein [Bacillota bacterium]
MIDFIVTKRNLYSDKISKVRDNKNIVFLTGTRRCGKTSIGIQLEEELADFCGSGGKVFRINFETTDNMNFTCEGLIEFFDKNYTEDGKIYFLLDEISNVTGWQAAVNHMYGFSNCKIFIFSSNSGVISDELDAVRNGNYDVIDILPLSLVEYILFHNFKDITPGEEIEKKRYLWINGREYSLAEIYGIYVTYGGLPIMPAEFMCRERARVILDGTYSAIVVRDIMKIDKKGNEAGITDPVLARDIIRILSNSIGRNISATGIKKYLAEQMDKKAATKTVDQYMRSFKNAHLFYTAERYDIRVDKILKTLAKYYVADAGIHNYLVGITDDAGRILENQVYFELKRRDYKILNGKIGSEKINFIAVNGEKKVYVQTVYELTEENEKKLLSPLRKVRDNHLKAVIAFNAKSRMTRDGIIIMNALEFFMGRPLAM